jgi:hypothetical protein
VHFDRFGIGDSRIGRKDPRNAGVTHFSVYLLAAKETEIRQKAPEYKLTSPPQALLPALINSNHVVKHLVDMAWHTADFSDSNSRLLTSDRPIIMTNGLSSEHAHVALPISPTHLFIAVRRVKTLEQFKSLDLVQITNNKVAEQAIKYVYGINASQLYFIAARLGKMVPSTPID